MNKMDKPRKVYHVIVGTLVGERWEVEAESEEEAREKYSLGQKISERNLSRDITDVDLQYNEYECLICGFDMDVEGDTMICRHCDNTLTIEEQRKELKKLLRIRD